MAKLPSRRDFLKKSGRYAVAAATTAHFMSSQISCSDGSKRNPNIIYIMADDLGYNDLGCYGQTMIKTPNIDQLAAEGMRFTDHYAGSTVCAPSRCSLMTGLHIGHAYIRGNREIRPMGQEPLPAGTATVAKALKEKGYTTALIGKWGLGGPDSEGIPNKQGFDYFFGYLCQRHAHNYYPEYLFRNEDRVPLDNTIENPRPDGAGVASIKNQYSHELITEEALAFIERNKDRPFFLYFSPTIPHANNEAGREGMEIPNDAPYSEEDWPQQEKNFAAMITWLDKDVGKIVQKVREFGLESDTVVFFTSDNGPHREGGRDPDFFNSNGALRGIKRDLYEGGIRVPMIVCWQGNIEPGSVTDHVSAFWDFMPTAAELAGIETPNNIDGISYLPTILGEPQKKHEYLYWEFHEGKTSSQAIRTGRWKAVRQRPLGAIELYDLEKDISEEHDLAGQQPSVVEKIRAIFNTARRESRLWRLKDIT